jgi:hypothetical protein
MKNISYLTYLLLLLSCNKDKSNLEVVLLNNEINCVNIPRSPKYSLIT